MVYCIVVNTVEILSLTVPAYTQSRQFYRLPSGLLCIVELGCVAFMMYSIKYLLREGFHGEGDCPQSTCVLPEERLGIVAYACEMINMVIHMEFSVMAFTHCAKRVVPRWLDYWDFERSHLASKRYQQLHHPQQFSQAPQSPRTTSPNAENSYELASMGGTRNTENGLETIVESSSPKKSSQEEYQN
ncbi:hypothetical protein P154DRAFT_524442 [Amniculicola lignicola CBS 123094]|uniref:Uncharacterized protein n=1 Tax=Amniculicola lignicola CBS 123094 TaxID=1392246 RepID=A0A6A5W814_9PLEO|nr:hypothetical protein P154DRAFT_524442 [Amniculicola lignicola CBS 123094]